MIGSQIGPYRVMRLLGKGGMGSVYEGVNETIERHVAIKVLHPGHASNQQILARFFNEARAVNRVAHPCLVQVQESGQLPDGTAYIVMEFLAGESVSERLARCGGRLPQKSALQLAWQVAAGLAAAHEKNIIHRDLKPANVMAE
jgi:serine/threonine protein kinase